VIFGRALKERVGPLWRSLTIKLIAVNSKCSCPSRAQNCRKQKKILQGRIKKQAFFIKISTALAKVFLVSKDFIFCLETWILWFSPSVHFEGILDKQFVPKLYLTVPKLIVECNNLRKSGLWSKIHQPHPEIF
jgi:hypothetical protein